MDTEESEQRAAQLIERRQYHEAEHLLTSLAGEGSVYAMTALAWIYENGCTDNKDTEAAQRLYEQAIARGNSDALLDLGLLLLKEDRQEEAQAVFERGVDIGDIGCSSELGWMLANAPGDNLRRAKGRKMLEDASGKGHLFARRRIISLDLSSTTSLIKKIPIFGRLLVLTTKIFIELYRNRRSDKIW